MPGVRISPSVLSLINKIKVAGIRTYIEEIVTELTTKVSWPTWQDLQTSSIIVLVTSVLLALVIWLMDYVFGIQTGVANADGWVWRGLLGFIYNFIN